MCIIKEDADLFLEMGNRILLGSAFLHHPVCARVNGLVKYLEFRSKEESVCLP